MQPLPHLPPARPSKLCLCPHSARNTGIHGYIQVLKVILVAQTQPFMLAQRTFLPTDPIRVLAKPKASKTITLSHTAITEHWRSGGWTNSNLFPIVCSWGGARFRNQLLGRTWVLVHRRQSFRCGFSWSILGAV